MSLPIVNTAVWWLNCLLAMCCQLSSAAGFFSFFSSFSCLWLCRVFYLPRGQWLSLLGVGGAHQAGASLPGGFSCGRVCGFKRGPVEGAWAHLLWGKGCPCPLPLAAGFLSCASRGVFTRLVFTWFGVRAALFAC